MNIVFKLVCDGIVVSGHESPPLQLAGATADDVASAVQGFELVVLSNAEVQTEAFAHLAGDDSHSSVDLVEPWPALPQTIKDKLTFVVGFTQEISLCMLEVVEFIVC